MSLLEQALASLEENQTAGLAEEWLDHLIKKLDDLIKKTDDEDLRKGGAKALDVIIANKSKFIALGKKSFILFIAYVASNRNNDAAKEYYRTKASPQEIIDSILDDAIDLNEIRIKRDELIEEALGLAKMLATGARYLLPLLLVVV